MDGLVEYSAKTVLRPHAVWTVRGGVEEAFDRYIVVSFIDVTLVLSIGDTVEEVLDSGFLATAPTLFVQLMADGSYVQVHPQGIRHLHCILRTFREIAPVF